MRGKEDMLAGETTTTRRFPSSFRRSELKNAGRGRRSLRGFPFNKEILGDTLPPPGLAAANQHQHQQGPDGTAGNIFSTR